MSDMGGQEGAFAAQQLSTQVTQYDGGASRLSAKGVENAGKAGADHYSHSKIAYPQQNSS